MRLGELLDALELPAEVRGPSAVDLTSITHDSAGVVPGAIFCCIPGDRYDGHAFAPAAVAAGAAALLVDRPLRLDVAQVVVDDVRAAMGPVAALLYGDPSSAMTVVGITGTNGKTTTTVFLQSILEADGRPTVAIGTLSPAPGGPPTTPDAPALQTALAAARDGGTDSVVMEVSSHALVQRRVDGTRFEMAVFTNLSRDHLDFHDSMETYFAAKARLFTPELTNRAVVNLDDPHGQLLERTALVPTVGYTLAEVADLQVGVRLSIGTWRGAPLRVPLGGLHNVSNALAALTVATELDVPMATALAGLAAAPPVGGRLEPVEAGQPFTVLVDYAHTPDGLEHALRASRNGTGRVIVVLGAGGDKDREKRPLMGDVAGRLADVVVLTSDNPRGEEPMSIIEAIAAGAPLGVDLRTEPDRRAAIAMALREARDGDVVLVAGKGHETTQVFADRTISFDDRVVVREELGRL